MDFQRLFYINHEFENRTFDWVRLIFFFGEFDFVRLPNSIELNPPIEFDWVGLKFSSIGFDLVCRGPGAPYACMPSCLESSYWEIKRLKWLRVTMRPILCRSVLVLKCSRTTTRNTSIKAILPFMEQSATTFIAHEVFSEWHLNSKIPNICIWLKILATSIRIPIVRSLG